jgi:hypothetical protein
MKRFSPWLNAALVIVILIGMVLSVMAAKQMTMSAKGTEVTMTGTLACTFCSLSHQGKPCPKGCCASCIKAGDPPLLIDAKGNMYLLTANEMQGRLMTTERMVMAGGKVTVKGLLVKGKGIQAIFVDSMKKAAK